MDPSQEVEVDQFVVCLFRRNEQEPEAAKKFIETYESIVRSCGGNVQIRTGRPKEWEVFDGRDNFREPNHLNPAIFDFTDVLVAGFRSTHDVHAWWSSDDIFGILKYRSCIDKMGVYIIEGLQQSFDVENHASVAFGERLVFMEFLSMNCFKPVQQYVDNYRLFAERSLTEIGMDCNLMFAESIDGVLMNEFPLDAVICSSWRMKSDALFFYDSESYQTQLLVLRRDYSRSLAMLMPMFDEKKPWEKAAEKKKQLALAKQSTQQALGS